MYFYLFSQANLARSIFQYSSGSSSLSNRAWIRNFLNVFSTGAVGYTVHKITGGKRGSQNVSSILIPSAINEYFKEVNTDPAYSIPPRNPIPPGARIPALEVLTHCPKVLSRAQAYSNWSRWASLLDVERFLPPPSSGDYEAVQSFIARTICPRHWKLANLTPIPKESPLTSRNQLRPISPTNIITRLSQKLILKFELFDVLKALIGPDQFAYKEDSNTTMALWSPSNTGWNGWIGTQTLYGYCHSTSSKHSMLFFITSSLTS